MCWLSLGLLSWLDYVTGYELAFSIFYLAPVMTAAWYVGYRSSLVMALTGAVLWWWIEQVGGKFYTHAVIGVWNALVRLGFFLVVVHLIRRERAELERIRDLSRHDFLTGAVNRRFLYELAEAEMERLRRYGRPLSLVYIDLDNFKTVNDTRGHEQGDELLRVVVATIREGLRKPDVVSRLGGDEFAVLMPETGEEQVRLVVERLRARVEEAMKRGQWPVSLSVGAVTAETATSVEELVQAADELMYRVKGSGKNNAEYRVMQATEGGVRS